MGKHDDSDRQDERWVRFGRFRYSGSRGLLFDEQGMVSLGGPETVLLATLLETPGRLVTKEELGRRMWPDRVVADCNLRWQVSSLRRRLGCASGSRHIVAVSGRGYRFVSATAFDVDPVGDAAELPQLLGRERELAQIVSLLEQGGAASLCGPAGIGKSVIAAAAARALRPRYMDGVTPVALAGCGAPADHVAAALGLERREMLEDRLRDRRQLLILDDCDAALPEVSALVARLQATCPGVGVLVTSRAALAIRFVTVGFLDETAALELFETHSGDGIRSGDLGVAALCARLDGYPLALALAASQAQRIGIAGLAGLLDDGFMLEMEAEPGGDPRHRTLAIALDGQYRALPAGEQRLLRRLSLLRGAFGLATVRALLPQGEAGVGAVLARLVAAGLVMPHEGDETFRLPAPIRAFALQRLAEEERETGPDGPGARHAELVCIALAGRTRLPMDLLANAEAALDWAFASDDRSELALRLVLGASRLWLGQGHQARALHWLRRARDIAQDAPSHVRVPLHGELARALVAEEGRGPELRAAARVLIDAAGGRGITPRLYGLWAQWMDEVNTGRVHPALATAGRYAQIAARTGDGDLAAVGDRLRGIALHLTGDQRAAAEHLDRTLAIFAWPERDLLNLPYHFDQRVVVLSYRARVALLTGDSQQALRMAEAAVAEGDGMGHPPSALFALVTGQLPVALLLERHQLAERVVARLEAQGTEGGVWRRIARAASGWLAAARGASGPAALEATLADIAQAPLGAIAPLAVCALAEAAGRLGRLDEALAMTRTGFVGAAAPNWYLPELLRVRADLLARAGETSQARTEIAAAAMQAQAQGAGFWSERIALTRGMHRLDAQAKLTSC